MLYGHDADTRSVLRAAPEREPAPTSVSGSVVEVLVAACTSSALLAAPLGQWVPWALSSWGHAEQASSSRCQPNPGQVIVRDPYVAACSRLPTGIGRGGRQLGDTKSDEGDVIVVGISSTR